MESPNAEGRANERRSGGRGFANKGRDRSPAGVARRALLREAGTLTAEDLTISVARVFGWNRRRQDIARRLDTILARMRRSKEVTVQAGLVSLPAPATGAETTRLWGGWTMNRRTERADIDGEVRLPPRSSESDAHPARAVQ